MMKIASFLMLMTFMAPVLASKGNCGEKIDPSNSTLVCSEIFNIFHKCTGKFLEESLDSANPFTLCTNQRAHAYYRNLTYWLDLLEKTYDTKINKHNISCSDEYLNKNKISVISHIVATSKGIWDSANCDDCYADKSSNHNFSESTVAFLHAFEKYKNCSTKYERNATAVCKNCLDFYLNLNQFFDHEKLKKEGKICFDLEDIMNKTRQEWSVDFKCCRDKKDSLKAFYSLFSTIMILTVIFYTSIYVTGSSYEEVTTLDAAEISSSTQIHPSTSSGSSSINSSSTKQNAQPDQKLISINDDDSDDELNILNDQSSSNNLVTLDN